MTNIFEHLATSEFDAQSRILSSTNLSGNNWTSTTALSVKYFGPVDPDNTLAFNSAFNLDISPYLA